MQELKVLEPADLEETTRMLGELREDAIILGGGTAVVLMLTQGLIAPRYLVNLARVPHLDTIRYEPGEGLRLGALATHRSVELSPLVREHMPVVTEVFHQVANVRVRNQATVGGVLAEADYASDPASVLTALDAEVRVRGERGERSIPVKAFITGFYETALNPDEVVSEVFIPALPQGTQASYLKFVSRSSEDRPCVGVATVLQMAGSRCRALKLVIGAVADTPQEFPDIEAMAAGERPTAALAGEIAAQYADRIEPLSDMRGSSWYRKQVIEALVRRSLGNLGWT